MWLAINTGGFPKIKQFDPWPFPILDLVLAFESILLASFILMRQSTDRAAHRGAAFARPLPDGLCVTPQLRARRSLAQPARLKQRSQMQN